jgi:hypothetical protein
VTGVSDHLDRGQWGEWLDPDEEFDAFLNPIDASAIGAWQDPFERSKHFLCNPWAAWPGMAEVVEAEREIEAGLASSKL